MNESQQKRFVKLSKRAEASVIEGAVDSAPVRGLTHNFYRYPARFSPAFARAAIEAFTSPGDLVLDNHVGGGTTLVEALALGRDGIGVDISSLAEFVSTVKTTVYTDDELHRLDRWGRRLPQSIDLRKQSIYFGEYDELGYYRHLSHPTRWRLRKAIELALGSAIRLASPRLEAFARCIILRTAQLALDGRRSIVSLEQFRLMLTANAIDMVRGAQQLRSAVMAHPNTPSATVLLRSAAGMEDDERIERAPRLVLTSPPYPGVHVLYHRWQVDGRKETPLPFMIANKLDGAGGSFYAMGGRKESELRTYFDNIRSSMASVAAIADKNTLVVQMVAFSDPVWQLPRYLETMEEAGLSELFMPTLASEVDGRLWRTVPGRRWYSSQRGATPGSQEVVLIHRKTAPKQPPLVQQDRLDRSLRPRDHRGSGSSAGLRERSRG